MLSLARTSGYNHSMRYVFIDDSAVAYDGYTPMRRPLGGAEKAVIGMASALNERGHEVKVINRVSYAHMAEGAYWTPFGDTMVPKAADVLIAMRKPALLGTLRSAAHRLLWVTGAPDYLTAPANEPLWDSFNASLLFLSQNQKRAYAGNVRNTVVTPGVRRVYFQKPVFTLPGMSMAGEIAPGPADDPHYIQPDPETVAAEAAAAAAANVPLEPPPPPPHAIVTTHPLQGLDWLIDVWTRLIHPEMPTARLSVYSVVLSKGLKGEEIPATMLPILEKVMAAIDSHVVVVDPRSDDGMNEAYRQTRVHLYPGDRQDYACWTLAESQGAGVPAVARGLGGTDERIDNGQTGFIVPDDTGFANVTLQILKDDAVYANLHAAAEDATRRRTWSMAAEELDAFVATLSARG